MKKFNVVFYASVVLVLLFVLIGALFPDQVNQFANQAFALTAKYLGGFYLVIVVLFIGFCAYLAFSRTGHLRLGQDNDRPEYSYFNWIGMLFSAGFGVSLIFWGVSEPIKHYLNPPVGYEAETKEAAQAAIKFAMFHWGIHQWAIFAVIGLTIGYTQFRRGRPGSISAVLEPLARRWRVPRGWRSVIDTLAVLATATGVATSLGLGVMQVNGGMNYALQIPDTAWSRLLIIGLLLLAYLVSSITGLNKGIRILSFVNLSAAFLLMGFAFVAGPSLYIFNSFISGVGRYLNEIIPLSFNIRPQQPNLDWLKEWTLFYWAWAIAWSPFVGSFIARVSKGRTIREFIGGTLLVPPLVAIAWMAIMGGSALYFETIADLPIADAVREDLTYGLFATLAQLPLGPVLTWIALALIFTFLVTSADSATFVLAMMTTRDRMDPPRIGKIVWGVLQAAVAAVLLLSSGLQGLQTASLLMALPFSLIMVLMCIAFLQEVRRER
ncbi:BCCT family transporter [Paenibacillus sp. IB182496]|uniref:BCCT family transporter n=2 Tax=Paenibacillus sabuli TaxID=2772509 RepID=A0A927BVR2_9BACL|nr:BCCT family transporter [Paenibacillus sabuli]